MDQYKKHLNECVEYDFTFKEKTKLADSFKQINDVCKQLYPSVNTVFNNNMYITQKIVQKHNISVPKETFPVPIMSLRKLVWYEKQWKHVCDKLEWEFVPSNV